MNSTLTLFIFALLAPATLVFLLSKCLFLSSFRVGFLLMIANLVYETVEIKLRLERAIVDALLLCGITVGWWVVVGAECACAIAVTLALLWLWTLHKDLSCRSGRVAKQFGPSRHTVPLPVPQLIVSIRGPVLHRTGSTSSLGHWPVGTTQEFEVLVLNPSKIHPQLPLETHITTDSSDLKISESPAGEPVLPAPGKVVSIPFSVTTVNPSGANTISVQVVHGDFCVMRTLCMESVFAKDDLSITKATIGRWKNGCRGAFVWRGDQDLYDPATFQSEEGLRVALEMARRFCIPSSLMLSSKLSLDENEHRQFCDHFGWNRRSEEIPSFIEFLRTQVDMEPEQEWPTANRKPFSMEIGNHCHLHYGTHAAADADNNWRSHARMGDGHYPWLSAYPADSYTEQRDNMLKGSALLTKTLGIVPASYTIPSDVRDETTSRAAEAAGLEVGSETDASKLSKLIRLVPPHHPEGCERFVELARMHPRDPANVFQLEMLKYWVGVTRRTGRAMVFLAHHHLSRYEGESSYHLTEELLRHVLADNDGDLYVGTMTAVGRYWRDVLSERTRCIQVTQEGSQIHIENSGSRMLEGLPLVIEYSGGRSHMRLVSVPAHSSLSVEL
ncbi:MAG: hypothetical protein HN700_13895 [Verrucomicrobia bacterium]|mgnify:CR=1 FL=1|jgi:hypothetical protein|nr:hypothetical protein [Verrucomicrobiota bacterium]